MLVVGGHTCFLLALCQCVLTHFYALSELHNPNALPNLVIANVMLMRVSSTGARLAKSPTCRLLCGRCAPAVRRGVASPSATAVIKPSVVAVNPTIGSITRGMAASAQAPKAAAVEADVETDVFTTNPLLAVSTAI